MKWKAFIVRYTLDASKTANSLFFFKKDWKSAKIHRSVSAI